MVQSRTLDFNAARSAVNVNKSKLNLLAPGLYSGYNVVIDSGTVGAGDTIEINSAPDVTSNLMTVEGVRVEENADPIATLGIATADGSNPRIDIVVAQHTHDPIELRRQRPALRLARQPEVAAKAILDRC